MPYCSGPDEKRVYYERHGDSGPVLILLNGLASTTRVWTPQLKDFSRDFQVITFDYPGHGHSERWASYSIDGLAEVARMLMDHLGVEKAHLMALSLGCNVALSLAAAHPERVERMVLAGPSGGIRPWYHPLGFLKYLSIWFYLLVLGLMLLLLGKERTSYLINKYGPQTYHYEKILDEAERTVDPRAVFHLTLQNACPPHLGKLHEIEAPTLLIRGRADGFPRRYIRHLATHLAGVVRIEEIDGARHVVTLEKPHAFDKAARQFLSIQI